MAVLGIRKRVGKAGLPGQGAFGVSWLGRVHECGPGDCRPEGCARASLHAALNLWGGVRGGEGQWDFNKGSITLRGEGTEEGGRAG